MLSRIVGALGWIGTTLVFAALAARVVGGTGLMTLGPAWDPYVYWGAVAGFACVVVYVLGQWRDIARVFRRRQARLGAMALTSVAAVLAILVMINYLAVRQSVRWDLTQNRIYSLSDQTRRILDGLDAPVRIRLFAQEPDFATYRDRLDEYANASSEVTVEYIDADRQPALARQYDVQQYGTTVFEYEGRVERTTNATEQDLTNALIKVLAGEEYVAYFTIGHGEHNPTDSDSRNGYSGISAALERDNYRVETLVLAQQTDVPDDADVVIIAGPRTDFFQPEIDALSRYIDGGGKVLFMIDPPADADSPSLPNLTSLVQHWGVQLGNDVVVDISGMGQLLGTDASVPVVASYPSHAITKDFKVLTAYPMARSVTPEPGLGSDAPFVQSIVQTSARSWAETNIAELQASGQVQLDPESGDRQGPISLAVAVTAQLPDQGAGNDDATAAADDEADGAADAADEDAEGPKPEIRLAVFGDSDFVANYTGNVTGNADLFLNTVNWLAQQENLIAIRARQPEDRRLTMTASQQRSVFWFSLLVMPVFIIGSGVYIWWQRR